jgi:hypothetical protein
MSEEETWVLSVQAMRFEYGTVVLQAGEDYGYTAEWLASLVRRIKTETPLAVTYELGEAKRRRPALWREAGRIGICFASKPPTGKSTSGLSSLPERVSTGLKFSATQALDMRRAAG